jgi:hypothetical protein
MKPITRLRPVIAVLCVAILACVVNRISFQAAGFEDPQVCSTEEPRDIANEHKWRWRAHQNLSCLISRLEQALNSPAAAGKDQVTLSRKEVELLFQLAWSGRDSAQRIGR